MLSQDLIAKTKEFFPNLKIKYKNESKLMKVLDYILFFNKDFMSDFVTVIGNTIYFPNKDQMKKKPVTVNVAFLHEIVHVYDQQKYNKFIFAILYIFPQILSLLFFPLLFISWKLAIIALLFLMPLPAYFRMKFEKRGYLASMYAWHRLSLKKSFNLDFEKMIESYIENFRNYEYYFMWTLNRQKLQKEFAEALNNIKNMKRPYEDKIFDILDELIEKI